MSPEKIGRYTHNGKIGVTFSQSEDPRQTHKEIKVIEVICGFRQIGKREGNGKDNGRKSIKEAEHDPNSRENSQRKDDLPSHQIINTGDPVKASVVKHESGFDSFKPEILFIPEALMIPYFFNAEEAHQYPNHDERRWVDWAKEDSLKLAEAILQRSSNHVLIYA